MDIVASALIASSSDDQRAADDIEVVLAVHVGGLGTMDAVVRYGVCFAGAAVLLAIGCFRLPLLFPPCSL